jgi:hypothetical protein
MNKWFSLFAGLVALAFSSPAAAFCGFYVAQANARLFNNASKVVLARKGERTVVTMASDYEGSPSNFAMVVPVPTIIRRDQVRVVNPALITRVDNYSAPRLVEYFDPDPCAPQIMEEAMAAADAGDVIVTASRRQQAKSLGVTIEARYQVGEYDILILSATQSNGLVTWLTQNGYKMPAGAAPVIGSYLRQNMKFFVAKVNLKRHNTQGAETLRPLQISYDSRKFMLPIRLGTVNARGPQELFVYALTPNGRVETTNYRTVKLKSDLDIPVYVKGEFPAFYRAMFTKAVAQQQMRAVFLEYAWDSGSCDPCSSEPLSSEEAKGLGARWADEDSVFVTRLHLRYTRGTFPEDLMLQETGDSENFQARYVVRHSFKGPVKCRAGQDYRNSLVRRWDAEARNLALLTGWDVPAIKSKMRQNGARPSASADSQESWLAALWFRVANGWETLFA